MQAEESAEDAPGLGEEHGKDAAAGGVEASAVRRRVVVVDGAACERAREAVSARAGRTFSSRSKRGTRTDRGPRCRRCSSGRRRS